MDQCSNHPDFSGYCPLAACHLEDGKKVRFSTTALLILLVYMLLGASDMEIMERGGFFSMQPFPK